MYHANRGDFGIALRLAEDLLNHSHQRGDVRGLILARLCLGATFMMRGEFVRSQSHLSEVDRLYTHGDQDTLVREAGVHPHAMAATFIGFTHMCLGYLDQALAWHDAGIEDAKAAQHRPSLAQTLSMKARFLCLGGNDVGLLSEYADQLFAIAVDEGFPYWRAQGLIFRGWVKARKGDIANANDLIKQGIDAYKTTGAPTWIPLFRAFEAETEVLAGRTGSALSVLTDTLKASRERGEDWFEAELLRRRGQLLQVPNPAAAQASYEEAIGIAQRQSAKLWELRASMSLARLWRDQGKREEARDLLAPVYGWFTEGFCTPVLQEAKALLDKLA
jgi:predicted ATPase